MKPPQARAASLHCHGVAKKAARVTRYSGDVLSREAFLASTLGEVVGYWLDIHCGCGATVKYPLRLMARERGARLVLRDVLQRLRCRKCGLLPARVDALDDPSAGTLGGAPGGWRLPLVP